MTRSKTTGASIPQRQQSPDSGRVTPIRRTEVSPLTVNRLSVYLRSLRALEERGIQRISSQQLAREFHLSSTQIRKDLSEFGEFGVRGIGYDVQSLAAKLSELLCLGRPHPLIIVGMGNLGTALARFPAFNSQSFQVVAGFDSDAGKTGSRIGHVPVHPLSRLQLIVEESGVRMAILAVPASAALAAFRALLDAGVHSVLNFAPTSLPTAATCRVKNVDLRIHLEELAFFLENPAP